jgi:hypothetical protein
MRPLIVIIPLIVLTTPGSLSAQVPPGAHVRLARPLPSRQRFEGSVVAASRDSLWLAEDGTLDTVSVPVESSDRVEVRVARSRPALALEGAGVGLLAGAVGGALVGPLFTSACVSATRDITAEGPCTTHLVFDTGARVRGAVAFGLAGTVLGAVIGGITGRARWRRVRVWVGGAPSGGPSLGLGVRF